MSVIATALRHMLAAGMDHDAIVEAVAAMECEVKQPIDRAADKRREWDRERKRRQRNSVVSGGNTVDEGGHQVERDTLSSPSGSSPKPLSPNPHQSIPPSPPKGGSSPTPKSELEAVLDADHADAVIQHRQKIRKPITAHGAKLLAAKFAQCSNPNEAADAMISNGWQGFEPQWLENRSSRQSQAPPRERTVLDAVNDRLREEDAARYDPFTIDHEPLTGSAPSADIRLPASSQGRRW